MNAPNAVIRQAWPYQQDVMSLPVNDLEAALPFYLQTLGFQLISRSDTPCLSAVLTRDFVQIGLTENGGNPTQDGCFFEVDDVKNAFAELKANELPKDQADFTFQQHGTVNWKVFFIVAPDGLCYCYGERMS